MLIEKTIKKHVAIIHAYSLMSVLQRKVVNILLYEANKAKNNLDNDNDMIAIECRIPFANLCKAVKFNSHNTKYLREAIDGLASLKIEWNLLKDKVPTNIAFLNLRVLHGPPTFFQDKTLNFSFHKVMLELVENPAIYGTVDLDIQSQFESKYSHSLYENSTRFVNLQKEKIIQLSTFKKLLGVADNKYASMRELMRNVVANSLEEVNDRAPFTVKLANIKVGKKIEGFTITVENKIKNKYSNHTHHRDNLSKEIKNTFGISNHFVIENILNEYREDYIIDKINYTKTHTKIGINGFYPAPYFISALKHNYQSAEKIKKIVPSNKPQDDPWLHTLHQIQGEIQHWQKMLNYAEINKNALQCDTFKKILTEHEQKLQHHLANKSK